MNNIAKYIKILPAFFALAIVSCTSQPDVDGPQEQQKGELRMGVSFGSGTRLAELPNANAMSEEHNGLSDVGLYVYYTSDYNQGIVNRPYIRNARCTVEDGELLVVPGEYANPADTRIFIYDEMTLVAFYPYNEDAADFQTKSDEDSYVITRRDYSQQYYIPYRAQAATNPTVSYYTQLNFVPKHVYKIEVLVVAEDDMLFPDADGLEVLPAKDPLENPDETDGMREKWYDVDLIRGNDGSGSDIRRYTSYIWTNDGTDGNPIKKGDVLMQSADGQFTLIASQDVMVQEGFVYRYGYNLSTGEIFIPTSSNLINDLTTLEGVNAGTGNYYQVCDIDMLQNNNWTPLTLLGGRYDGGGHALNGMTINTTENEVGLFGRIQANSTVCNVNLVNPTITVNSTADSVAVGGIVGLVNRPLTEADREKLIGNFPPELSEIVKRALLEELLQTMGDNQSSIVASRVVNPTIIVNGKSPRVGTVAGNAGSRDESGTYRSSIRDTYSIGGSIAVNVGNEEDNEEAHVGGFIGMNNGYITRGYTTTSDITAEEITDPEAGTKENVAAGFGNMGTLYSAAEGGLIEQSFAANDDANGGVSNFNDGWPTSGWINYSGIWPINTTSWLGTPNRSFWYSIGSSPADYPTLQWERR